MVMKLKIGVLAVQGDVSEHKSTLKKLKVNAIEVRLPKDLQGLHGLIIPGGESTTISKLLKQFKLDSAIKKSYKKGMHVYGTCAGAILVSKKILNENTVKPLKLIDITVKRNAYGRQTDSFETTLKLKGKKFRTAFIRAPIISSIGKRVEVLCQNNNKPVLVQSERILAGTFHTEIYDETAVHEYFLEKIKKRQ